MSVRAATLPGKPSVFIVDDDVTALCALETVLSKDYRIRTFCNLTAFVAEATSTPPDVVICDKHLGADDNVWAPDVVRTVDANIEVILYSGDPAEGIPTGPGTGLFACLTKGARLAEIRAAVAAAAERRKRVHS